MSKHEDFLMKNLTEGETITKKWDKVLCSRISQTLKAEKVNKGMFAITNKRAVFASDGMFSSTFEDLKLEDINSIQIHSGFLSSDITLEGKSLNSLKLVSMSKDDMFEIKKTIGK